MTVHKSPYVAFYDKNGVQVSGMTYAQAVARIDDLHTAVNQIRRLVDQALRFKRDDGVVYLARQVEGIIEKHGLA